MKPNYRIGSIGRYRKHLPILGALFGTAVGYFLIHPFGVVVHELSHLHCAGSVSHLHSEGVAGALRASFSFAHLPQAALTALLAGAIGYLLGKVLLAYETINEQLGRFAVIGENLSQIMHDAKSPAAVIVTYARVLKEALSGSEHAFHCGVIERQAKRFLSNLEDINLIVRHDAALPLHKTPVKLRPFLEDVIADMNLRPERSVECVGDEEAPIDRGYFVRVVWNLLSNANDALAGKKDGEIRIKCRRDGESVLIEMSDNGPGIAADVLPRLFILGNTFGKTYGTGIGLYSCKRIVEAHGGDIRITSKPGSGTTVHIEMPAARGLSPRPVIPSAGDKTG